MKRYPTVIALSGLLLATAIPVAIAPAVGCNTAETVDAVTTQPATSQPAMTQPVNVATTSAITKSSDDVQPDAMAILLALQAAGQQYPTVQADVEFHELLAELGDEQTRTGWVAYQGAVGEDPAKFRIHFDRLRLGLGRPSKEKVDYAFDGHWFSVAKHKIKDMQHYQVVPAGGQAQPLKLGKGPFPVPFGQRADDVVKYCNVTTRASSEGDPANTDYLKCITRREYRDEINFRKLEMWIDRATHLPVKIASTDASKTILTVTFSNIKPRPASAKPLKVDMFHFTDSQFGAGWSSARHPLQNGS